MDDGEKNGCKNWRENVEALNKTFVLEFLDGKHDSSFSWDSE